MLAVFSVLMWRKLFDQVGVPDKRLGAGMVDDYVVALRIRRGATNQSASRMSSLGTSEEQPLIVLARKTF